VFERMWPPQLGLKDVRHNFLANWLDGAFFSFGLSFISFTTVAPVLVRRMGGSSVSVALIQVIWILGFNFPQIIMANKVQRFPLKKKLVVKTALIQRIPFLLLGLVTLFIVNRVDAHISLVIFFIGLAMAAVTGSINLPGWFDLVAKITPVELRGRLFAVRSMMGSLLGILGGWVAHHVLNTIEYPYSFSLLFGLTVTAMTVSYFCVLSLRETQPDPPRPALHTREFLSRLPQILRTERNYRHFLIADAALYASLMADSFYAVNAMGKFSLTDGYAGNFTMVMMFTITIAILFFGHLADTFGHKVNMIVAACATALACITALTAGKLHCYYFAFAGSATTTALIQVSRLPLIAEICEKDRPTFIALTNMITSPFILLGLLGGVIADKWGYAYLFAIAGCLALFSAAWWSIKVVEPRKGEFLV
jgi:MFS family permease